MAKLMATLLGLLVTAVLFLSVGGCGVKTSATQRGLRPRQRTSGDSDTV